MRHRYKGDFWESFCSLLLALKYKLWRQKKVNFKFNFSSPSINTCQNMDTSVSSTPTLFKTFVTLYHLKRSISNFVVLCFNVTSLESNKVGSKCRCCYLMAVYLKASYLICLSFSYLVCTMLEITAGCQHMQVTGFLELSSLCFHRAWSLLFKSW